MSKLPNAPPAEPSMKNVMEAAQKYLPVHEQCSALKIDVDLSKNPGPDRLLNSIFPEAITVQENCGCDAGKAVEINRCLDVLTEMFQEHRNRSN